ncbi:MAG: hypothetical protein GZ089_12585, partial [Aromatoleum sp.]|nr:hypothetical protein [Aromatoleum sp.]
MRSTIPTMPSFLFTRQLARALIVGSLAFGAALPARAADDELAALVESGRSAEAWSRCGDRDP